MEAPHFDLVKAASGAPLVSASGRPLRFIAYVPDAQPHEQVILLHEETREVHTHWADGRFMMNRQPSVLDAIVSR